MNSNKPISALSNIIFLYCRQLDQLKTDYDTLLQLNIFLNRHFHNSTLSELRQERREELIKLFEKKRTLEKNWGSRIKKATKFAKSSNQIMLASRKRELERAEAKIHCLSL